MELIAAFFVGAAVMVALLHLEARVRRSAQTDLKSEVVVHTNSNQSIRGILVDSDDRYLRLADARYLNEATPIELEGRIRIPRANEAYTQLLGG